MLIRIKPTVGIFKKLEKIRKTKEPESSPV